MMQFAPPTIHTLRDDTSFLVARETLPSEDGVELLRLTFRFASEATPPPIRIEWSVPVVEIAGKWHPAIGADRSLTAEWGRWLDSYATLNAPVVCLFSAAGRNHLTFAVSEAIAPVKLQAMVEEEDATVGCRIVLFDAPTSPIFEYSIVLRRDARPVDYSRALADVAAWWAAMPEYPPAPVPAAGFDPVYSTWYGFHQKLAPETIEKECRWARDLGCGAVIVDDGWQCDDSNKGYDFCGDWKPASSKFPDFPGHVRRIRELGLKYLLWFSVPYAGARSEAWRAFQGRLLVKPRSLADCLDPRYQSVRAYLVDCYRHAVGEWGVDGLKLDFVDRFTAELPGPDGDERPDMVSVPAAANRLLSEVLTTLQTLKPDVLIEFRQKYVGPAMRKHGHLFRAGDCPNDAMSNRIRTLDVRLLAGNTAVHSDMIMWHRDETPEQVAVQLWATLFSVPQISVRRDAITPAQERVLRFYLGFWLQNRKLLMLGRLRPLFPQELYPLVCADDENGTLLIACYAARIVSIDAAGCRRLILINATERASLAVEFGQPVSFRLVRVLDCLGVKIDSPPIRPFSGLALMSVPCGGVCELEVDSLT